MNTNEQVLNHCGMVVLRDIDWGYACQFWLLDMKPKEFEAWWEQQESFEEFHGTPGELAFYEAIGTKPPPVRMRPSLPGKRLGVDSEEDMELWMGMSETNKHYFCMLCCDSDSYLKTPDGRMIHHKGYHGDQA